MAMTAKELALFNYLQQAYPGGLRAAAGDSDSLIYKYDEVRAVVISYFNDNMRTGMSELLVTTASENGIEEWERYLGITVNDSLPLSVRRGAVLAKLIGKNATVATIKAIVATFVEGRAGGYTLRELYLTDESPEHDDTWTYEVRINEPLDGQYDTSDLQSILEDVHPAHCQVIIVIIPPVEDQMSMQDSIDMVTSVVFEWVDEGAGTDPDEGEWTDEDPYFQAGYVWDVDDGSYYPLGIV